MLFILLPCRTFTVVFRCLISFLQKVSYSVQTHSLHCYLHAVYTLTLSYLHCCISMLNLFLQKVSYSVQTHSMHCYLHAVYTLTLSYLHYHILMLNFIPSVGKLFCTDSLSASLHAVYSLTLLYLHCRIRCFNFIPSVGKLFRTYSLSAWLLTCCLFSYPVVPSLSYFDDSFS